MTASVVLPDAPEDIAGQRLFAVHDLEFTVADVARRARLGDRELLVAGDDPAAVQESFRRARGLLTADRLTDWLADWSITPDEFQAWSESPSGAGSWAALVCSGALEVAASEVAAAAAAACELGAAPSSAARFDPTGWTDRLTAQTLTPAAVHAVVAANRLGWTTVVATGALARDRAIAEELRQCVLADRLELADAAARAGCRTYVVDGLLEVIEPAPLRALLAGAAPGELVGPLAAGPIWTVLQVESRTEPDPTESAILTRAQAAVRDDVIRRAVLRHVNA